MRSMIGITAFFPASASFTAATPSLYDCSTSTLDAIWRVAFPVGSEAAGGRDPPRVPAHHLHDEDPCGGLRHRGDVETGLADRSRDVFRDRAETRAVVGDRKIVVDGLGNAHADEGVT